MNKNIIKLFAILMMCFMLVSVLVACGDEPADEVIVKDGEDGKDGQDGLTPFIKDGYWWIGETNTGVKAEGKDADSIRCDEHDWDTEVIVLKEHTVDSIGVILKVCVDCDGAEFVRINHEYDAVVTAPTCTSKGYTTHTCDCGLSYVDSETEMLPHAYDSVVTAPTCTATGYTTHTCADCGYVLVDTETPMVAHEYGAWEPSLWDDGVDLCDCLRDTIMVRFCTVCDTKDSETKVIPAKGHDYTTWEPSINKTETSPCELVPLQVAHCDVCGHEECNSTRPVPGASAPGHKWGEWVVVTEPTATTEGLIKSVCSECGDEYESGVKTEVLPVLEKETNYTYTETPADCENAGEGVYTYTKYESVVIKVVIPAKGHNYTDSDELTNLVAPTTTTPGSVTVGCVDCDHTTTVEIPAVGSEEAKEYIVDQGNCLDPIDTYCMPLNVEGHEVLVTFEAKGDYEHDEEPASEELTLLEGDGKWYWAYWCTKCEHWIIVDWTEENPNA